MKYDIRTPERAKKFLESRGIIFEKFVEAILKELDIRPQNEWINVKDKLPKQGKRVLVHRRGSSIPVWIGAYGFFKYGVWGEREDDDWNVTHWMPLPEPPQNTAQAEEK